MWDRKPEKDYTPLLTNIILILHGAESDVICTESSNLTLP
jgi:hypothetical protein